MGPKRARGGREVGSCNENVGLSRVCEPRVRGPIVPRIRCAMEAVVSKKGATLLARADDTEAEREITKSFTRELLNMAESDIKLADFIVRNNRREGVPDDPESTRKLRLSFRRVQYRLKTMADIEATLGAEPLIGRLREVGKPFGRLRDAEILESSVIRALGQRVATPQGRQLMELAAHVRRAEQRVTDDLLNSDAYQKTLSEVSEFRAALPSRHASSEMLRPMAQRAMHLAWRELERHAKIAKRAPTNKNLHHTRITAKRTLYAAQALSDVLGPPVEEFARRVDAFQKFLGKQHDLVIATAWFREVARTYPGLRKLAKTLAVEEESRARKRAKRWRHYWNSVQVLHPGKLW
jgi:CHAD domain-containing protein